MPHDARVYLSDVVEACTAILDAVAGADLATYTANRLIRSAVEREFILIGEAMAALHRTAPAVFESITNSRRIVDFRNQLTHEYATVDDEVVWAVATSEVAVLRAECEAHLRRLSAPDP